MWLSLDGKMDLQEKTHTDQYVNWQSHHPIHQKVGVICTLFNCAKSLTTEELDRWVEVENIKSVVKQCAHDYSAWAFKIRGITDVYGCQISDHRGVGQMGWS